MELDEEKDKLLFFQKVNDNPIYFNQNAMLTINWNEDENIISYEQRCLESLLVLIRKKNFTSPIEAIKAYIQEDYLKTDSTVINISLGYSTLIQLTKTQVFAPTWHVRVKLEDGEIEDYFINAMEGKLLSLKMNRRPRIDENVEDMEIE